MIFSTFSAVAAVDDQKPFAKFQRVLQKYDHYFIHL